MLRYSTICGVRDNMKTSSISRKLMLSIVLLLSQANYLAARNEEVCKLNYDVYVPSNKLQCQDNASDNDLSVIERYRPTKKFCTSNFNTTGILSLPSALLNAIKIPFFF